MSKDVLNADIWPFLPRLFTFRAFRLA